MIDITVFATMALLLIGYAAVLYSGLRRARRRLARAWLHLDFAWDRRDGDLLKLLELCRQDDACEGELIERALRAREALQDARHRRDVSAVNDTEEALRRTLTPVFPAAARQRHGHPEAVVRALRLRIQAHEQAIAAAHTRYNEAASALNSRIEMLPEMLIASLCGMTPVALLQCDAPAPADIDLGLAFSK
ncbi:MAG: LemA family protein [Pseudomonadota bacterium]|jgi:LemA protein|nr:LemA family protein [Pseudomonadota bacterium]